MTICGLTFAALFIVLAIIFLMGKGNKLIAGYNTLSEEITIVVIILANTWAKKR